MDFGPAHQEFRTGDVERREGNRRDRKQDEARKREMGDPAPVGR
jgi:hypothetical protein